MNAFDGDPWSVWGGRGGNDGLWIGIDTSTIPTDCQCVRFKQKPDHCATALELQMWQTEEVGWQTVASFADLHPSRTQLLHLGPPSRVVVLDENESSDQDNDDEGENEMDSAEVLEPVEMSELFATPSKPMTKGQLADFSQRGSLQPLRSDGPFRPDANFYNAVDCDGLWVCTSKSVEPEVLQKAVKLIRSIVPLELRRCFGKFQSPRWAKDPGPMRVIILDNRTDEQAGIIPGDDVQ
jgi:hypothetical protein